MTTNSGGIFLFILNQTHSSVHCCPQNKIPTKLTVEAYQLSGKGDQLHRLDVLISLRGNIQVKANILSAEIALRRFISIGKHDFREEKERVNITRFQFWRQFSIVVKIRARSSERTINFPVMMLRCILIRREPDAVISWLGL